MPVITIEDVRSFCSTPASDTVINLYISSVTTKIGACLDKNYDAATASLIALNVISHMLCGGEGKVESIKAPNGASKSYSASITRAGLRSSKWGEQAYMLDTNGCTNALFSNSFLIATVGGKVK